MSIKQLVGFALVAPALAGPVPPGRADDPPAVQVDAATAREAKLDGVRVVLLSAGCETVFTGDADPKKATTRRLNVVFLVEPLGKDPKGPALAVGPVRVSPAGSTTEVKLGPGGGTVSGKSAAVKSYDRKDRLPLPKVGDELQALVFERSIGPLASEPERIDLQITARNRGAGGTCVFKGIRVK